MRRIAIGLLGCLALTGMGAGARAQSLLEGQECRPPVASAAGYRDCRTRDVAGQQICRCRIAPGLDLTRRSSVGEAVSAVSPRARSGHEPAAASVH